jgi:5-methylcytosine-specific restriction protein A
MTDTHLIAWNPDAFPAELVADIRERLLAGEDADDNWSVGRIKHIAPGSRFFMIRLGVAPKGIVGAGTIMSAPYKGDHYNPYLAEEGRELNYVDVKFQSLRKL